MTVQKQSFVLYHTALSGSGRDVSESETYMVVDTVDEFV